MSERRLAREFEDGFECFNSHNKKIVLKGDDKYEDEETDIELLHHYITMFAAIDRDENKNVKVGVLSMVKGKLLQYRPDLMNAAMSHEGLAISLNMNVCLQVRSSLHLDVESEDGQLLVDGKEGLQSHVMTLEGVLIKQDLKASKGLAGLLEIYKFTDFELLHNFDKVISELTITDFDDFLKGNPHIPDDSLYRQLRELLKA